MTEEVSYNADAIGTMMYCPECKRDQKMRVVNPRNPFIDSECYDGEYDSFPHGSGQFDEHPGINVYHRVRECGFCSMVFDYYEIDGRLMSEFLRLKSNEIVIENLVTEVDIAAKSISKIIKKFKK